MITKEQAGTYVNTFKKECTEAREQLCNKKGLLVGIFVLTTGLLIFNCEGAVQLTNVGYGILGPPVIHCSSVSSYLSFVI